MVNSIGRRVVNRVSCDVNGSAAGKLLIAALLARSPANSRRVVQWDSRMNASAFRQRASTDYCA
jgi:hypothetical protein